MEVEELFEHLPARKAYLRSPQEEASRCLAVVQAYSLLWPRVAFVARCDGKAVFSTSGSGELRSAVAAVWGPQLAGELLAVAAQVGDVAAAGLLSPPHGLRRDSSRLVIGIRGRPVRAPAVEAMLEEACHPFLTLELRGRRPQGVLALSLPPELVDPNVHPAKLEVRLRDPQRVRGAISQAVRHALGVTGAASPPTPPPPPSRARPQPAQAAAQPELLPRATAPAAAFLCPSFPTDDGRHMPSPVGKDGGPPFIR